jgi:hypothetical protein
MEGQKLLSAKKGAAKSLLLEDLSAALQQNKSAYAGSISSNNHSKPYVAVQ